MSSRIPGRLSLTGSSFWPLNVARPTQSGVVASTAAPKCNPGLLDGVYKRHVTRVGQTIDIIGVRGSVESGWTVSGVLIDNTGAGQSVYLRPLDASGTVLAGLSCSALLLREGTDTSPFSAPDASNWYIGTIRANAQLHFTITIRANKGMRRSFDSVARSCVSGTVTLVAAQGDTTDTTSEICGLQIYGASATGVGIGSYAIAKPIAPKPRLIIRPTDTVLFTGDSLTEGAPQSGCTWAAGSNIEPAWDSYAGVLRREIDAKCLALSGRTPTWRTSGVGLTKIADLNTNKVTRIGAYAPDVVIALYGIVDTNAVATTSAAFKASYQAVIDYSRTIKSDCRWMVVSPLCRGERPDGQNGNGGGSGVLPDIDVEVERIRTACADVACSRTNVWFTDLRGAWQEFEDQYNASGSVDLGPLTSEGTHPIFPGQEFIANTVLPSIQVTP